jgi:hypothetical protein
VRWDNNLRSYCPSVSLNGRFKHDLAKVSLGRLMIVAAPPVAAPYDKAPR